MREETEHQSLQQGDHVKATPTHWFTPLNHSGHKQVQTPEGRPETTFSIDQGLWQFQVFAPFGSAMGRPPSST